MTRSETSFVHAGDLIIVKGRISGPAQSIDGRFVLDTGAAMTTMTHEFVEALGVQPTRRDQTYGC